FFKPSLWKKRFEKPSSVKESGRWDPYRQASPPPARHRPGARSARRERCLSILSQTGREAMKHFSTTAGLALAIVVVLGLVGPVAAGEQVPFKGSLEGDVTRGAVDFPFVDVLVEGTGNGTHLGKFTFVFPHTVHIPTRTAAGTYYLVAANGDTLTADATGLATPIAGTAILHIEETLTIPGGTGQFAGATGSVTVERLYDTVAGMTIGSFEGTISRPGP